MLSQGEAFGWSKTGGFFRAAERHQLTLNDHVGNGAGRRKRAVRDLAKTKQLKVTVCHVAA